MNTTPKSVRVQKVEKELREIIGQVLPEMLYFDSGVLISVIRVEAASDLRTARVFVSVFPDDAVDEVMEELDAIRVDVQNQISRKIRMKYLPKIKWMNDHSVSQLVHVSKILNESKKPPATED